jgi:AcrR family transcriptional regulator
MVVASQSGLKRDERKSAARNAIIDALIAILTEGGEINHDRVAERARVGRRTVYRYFPDREMLMQSIWDRVTMLAGPRVTFPGSEAEMLETLPAIYRGFDEIAPLATLLRTTPQGRAVRLSEAQRRRESYRRATADAVKELPAEDQVLATAMLQVLHTTPWLEMRDQWKLNGDQIAQACGWAMRVLLKDLRARGDKPLDEGPA